MRTVDVTFARDRSTIDALRPEVKVIGSKSLVTLQVGLPFMERGTFEWDVPGKFGEYRLESRMLSPQDWYEVLRRRALGAW